MKIYIGCDHRGVNLKKELIKELRKNYIVIDTKHLNSEVDDYPDFAFEVGENVINNEDSIGILICGNGIGISIAANKVSGIRCARVLSTDDAYKAKSHNNANIIALSSVVSLEDNLDIINTFINSNFDNEEKNRRRVNKIISYEMGEYNEL